MDINLLVLSVGNSRLAIGTFEAGELTHVSRVALGNRGEWQGKIAEAWQRLKDAGQPAVAAAGVVPAVVEPLEHAVQQATGQPVQWVGRQIELPIPVRTDEPEKTGVDRVLNVAAAYEQINKACVVVDAGTAVTVDCCGDDGAFLGGAIMPGLRPMLDALHQRTAKLPQVDFDAAPTGAYGANTTSAVRHGVYYAIRGMVKEVVENYATQLGTWPELIATGGDAKLLFGDWELVHAVSPDLTLYGVALAYAEHHIKHGT